MSNNCHIQKGNCMLIAVPLNASCAIEEDAPVYVTAGVGTLSAEAEREAGTDYSLKNFGGDYCGPTDQGMEVEKWLNLSGEFCMVNWALMAAMSGNIAMQDAEGNVVGYQQLRRSNSQCQTTSKDRFALTVIRKAATGDGGCVTVASETGATEFVAYTYPNVTDVLWAIPPHADERAVIPFTAKSYTNPNIGRGPLNLIPEGSVPQTIDSEALYAAYFVDPADLPEANCEEPIAHPVPLGETVVEPPETPPAG